jgi:hypothetical protein
MTDIPRTTLVVSYFGNRYLDHARDDLRAMAEMGADAVVHVMSEADMRWNPGTMADLVALSREAGLTPWLTPWGLGGVFGGESASYAVGEHPEACQRASDGRHLPALCPRQPVFRDLIRDWTDAAAAAGAVIVQWDELHLAMPYRGGGDPWACRCDACQEAFRDRFGYPMPETATPEVIAFFDDLIRETLAWMVEAANERGMGSSIVLLADAGYDPELWRSVAALPGARYFGTTAFWLFYGIPDPELEAYLGKWTERTLAATAGSGAEPMAWVQGFGVPAGREAEIETAVDVLVRSGVSTVAVWSYLACAAMSGLAPDDPRATWDAVMRAFAKVDAARNGRG